MWTEGTMAGEGGFSLLGTMAGGGFLTLSILLCRHQIPSWKKKHRNIKKIFEKWLQNNNLTYIEKTNLLFFFADFLYLFLLEASMKQEVGCGCFDSSNCFCCFGFFMMFL